MKPVKATIIVSEGYTPREVAQIIDEALQGKFPLAPELEPVDAEYEAAEYEDNPK